jgi:hypothetical protein
MPGNPREIITMAERRFPARIRIGVPPWEPDSNRWSLAERPALGRVSKKSVEQQLDAKDEAWPKGRQRSQAMLPFTRARNLKSPQCPTVG